MSDEIKKICNNCDNLQYGFGESSINYGPRCFEKDCGVDENDTCDMFEIASYLKVKKLQEQNKILREALEFYANADNWVSDADNSPDFYDCIDDDFDKYNEDGYKFQNGGKRAREALAKVNNENN